MTSLDVIRTLTVRAVPEGFSETERALKGLASTYGETAKVTETASRRSLSASKDYERLRTSVDATYRSQQQFAKGQSTLDRAMQQGVIGAAEHARMVGLLRERYASASAASNVSRAAMQELRTGAMMASGSLGSMGSVLTSLGPVGIAVGLALGGVALAVHQMVQASVAFADKAGKLVDFAETTGLSTDALQGLHKAASQVGLTADQVGHNIERFTAKFSEMRRGVGQLHEQILAVNPALAREMMEARSVAEAFDLYNKAISQANELDRVRLARAGFGRAGAGMIRIANYAAERGGLQGLINDVDAVDLRTKQYLQTLDQVADQSKYSWEKAKDNFTTLFALPVLSALNWIAGKFLELSRYGASALGSLSGDSSGAPTKITVTPKAPDLAAEALERQRVATIASYNEMQRWMSVMGSAATPAQQLELRVRALRAAEAEGKISAEQLAKAQGALQQEYRVNQIQATVGALGSAATATEQYTAAIARLQQQLSRGEISQQTFNRAVGGLQADRDLQMMRDRVSALGDAATATDQYQLRAAELQRQLDQGRISQETFNRASLAANPLFRQLKEVAEGFTQDLVAGLMRGESLMDALGNAAMRLSQQLASRAITQALSGDFMGAAVSGIGALISGIFGSSQQRRREQEQRQREAADRAQQIQERIVGYQERTQLAALSAETIQNELARFEIQANRERRQEAQTGSQGMVALEQALAAERLNVITEFNKRAAELERQHQEEIEQRRLAAQDRVFAAIVDTSTLTGALAAFDRKAEQERRAEIKAGGETIADLEAALAAERLNVIAEFNDKIVDEQKRAAEEQLKAIARAARQITEYIGSLRVGAASPLSPMARLAEAQALYAEQFAKAQGGDLDALGSITQYADKWLDAAREVFASSAGFQSVFDQINTQMLELVDLATPSSDPIVAAIEQVHASTEELVNLQLSANNLTNSAVALQNTANALLTQISALTNTSAAQLQLLNSHLLEGGVQFAGTTRGGVQISGVSVTNNMLTALNKIVWNTYRIALNTGYPSTHDWVPLNSPTYALGGIVSNGLRNIDSVTARLAGGEHITRAPSVNARTAPTLDYINRTGMIPAANDNGPLLAEMRMLRRELAVALARLAQIDVDGTGAIVGAIDRRDERGARAARQAGAARQARGAA